MSWLIKRHWSEVRLLLVALSCSVVFKNSELSGYILSLFSFFLSFGCEFFGCWLVFYVMFCLFI